MTRSPRIELTVPDSLAGERLDRAMAALAPALGRGEARRLIDAGAVFVDGRRTRICSRPVRAGEQITCDGTAGRRPPPLTVEPRLVLTHADLWIVDKPHGMPVEPTRSGAQGTLAEWLRRGPGKPFVTHRLDAATSGLVVVARHARAQAELNRLFAAHAVRRRYLAIVAPPPPWSEAKLDAPLDGRAALTHATVMARAPAAAALAIELGTGRTRQIRRHLAAAGFPVVGETAAGHRAGPRLLLHAAALEIPWAGATLAAASPPPADFQAAAAALSLVLPPAR
jgi:23S rRNA-/tRNA-specific pseudouridylate synthase